VILVYDEKAKARTMKYMKEKRENLNINLPLGSKERYKKHAESRGKSLTSLIVDLVEADIRNSNKPVPDRTEQNRRNNDGGKD